MKKGLPSKIRRASQAFPQQNQVSVAAFPSSDNPPSVRRGCANYNVNTEPEIYSYKKKKYKIKELEQLLA